MISCKFCSGKSQSSYLFLACNHLSCLQCAFSRADFGNLEMECCSKVTKIDEGAIQMIIRNKRNTRARIQNNQNKIKVQTSQITINKKQQSPILDTKQNQSATQNPQTTQINNFNKIIDKDKTQIKKQNLAQQDSNQLQNILVMQIDRVKRECDIQRMIIQEKQKSIIQSLISAYEQQIKNIEKPISQAKLQKFNLSLSKNISFPMTKRLSEQQSTRENFSESGNLKKSRESYDHILKRLELNQQRMKQKIQKHLQVLY